MNNQVACLLRQIRDKMSDYYAPDYSLDAILGMRPAFMLHDNSFNFATNSVNITGWGDISGNKAHATVGGSNPTISRTLRRNKNTYATLSGVNRGFTIPEQDLKEFFLVCNPAAANGLYIAASKPSNWWFSSSNSSKRPQYSGATLIGGYGSQTQFEITSPRILTFRVKDIASLMNNAANQQLVTYGANGFEVLGARLQTDPNMSFNPTRIGNWDGTYDFVGTMYCAIGFTRTLTLDERYAVMQYLSNRYLITLPTYNRFIGFGDSIMAGQALTASENLIGQTFGVNASGFLDASIWSAFNAGVGNNMTHDLVGQGTHALDLFYKGAKNFAGIWVGTNNWGATTTGLAVDDVGKFCEEVRRRGGYSVIIPMTPRVENAEAFRTPLNLGYRSLVENGYADFYYDGDTLCPTIYDPAAPSNAALYPDGLHPSALAQTAQATAFSTFLDSAASTITV